VQHKLNKIYIIDSITTAILVSRMKTQDTIDVIFEYNINSQRSGSAKNVYELILSNKSYRLLDTIYIQRPYHIYALKNPFRKMRMLRDIRDHNITKNLQLSLCGKTIITSSHSTLLWACYTQILDFEEVCEGMQEIIFPIKENIIKKIIKKNIYSHIFPTIPKCRYVFSKHYVRSKTDIIVHEKYDNVSKAEDILVILNTEGKDDGHFGGRAIADKFIKHNLETIYSHASVTKKQCRYILKTHPALGQLRTWLYNMEVELTKRRINFCYADELINLENAVFVPTEYFIENLGIRNILLCDVTSTVFNYDKLSVKFFGNSNEIIDLSKRNETQYALAKRFFQLFTSMEEI
jgi:hypothetical protein